MTATVVFDLDKVLLGGDATTLFLHGRLREASGGALPLLLAFPLLLPTAAVPHLRPLTARALTRLGDVDVVGSTGSLFPPRVRRAIGETKVRMLTERGYPPPWSAAYSDSPSDLPLLADADRPVLVNADEKSARQVKRVLGRPPETRTWR